MTALIARCVYRRFKNAAVLYAAHTPMVASKTPWTAAFSGSQRPDDSSSRSNTLLCSTARASHASAVQMLILARRRGPSEPAQQGSQPYGTKRRLYCAKPCAVLAIRSEGVTCRHLP